MNIADNKINLLKKYLADKTTEIEARFGSFDNKNFTPVLTKEQHDRLFFFFNSKPDFYKRSTVVQEIQYSNGLKKITNINEDGAFVTFMKKEKITNIDVPDYNFRFGISIEKITNGKDFKENNSIIKRIRETFVCREAGLKIDLTRYTNKDLYEIEIELIHELNPSLDVFLKYVNLVLCIIQETKQPVSTTEIRKVIKIFKRKFPGIQPVALKNGMIDYGEQYAITKKLDGVRCILIVVDGCLYAYFKNQTVKKVMNNVKCSDDNIMFDAEYFSGSYNIFDCFDETKPLKQRLDYIVEFLLRLPQNEKDPIVKVKTYYFTGDKFSEVFSSLCHDIAQDKLYDGLIVVKPDQPYSKSCPLKWKKMITFDFVINDLKLYYATKTGLAEFGTIQLDDAIPNGTIVECYFADNRWNILKLRPDKTAPNFSTTVLDNWDTLQNPFVLTTLQTTQTTQTIQTTQEDKLCQQLTNLSIKPGENLKRFQNYVKRLVIDKLCKNSQNILDLDMDDGTDIAKYIDTNIKTIYGISTKEEATEKKEYFLKKSICKNFNILLYSSLEEIADKHYDVVISKGSYLHELANLNSKTKVVFCNEKVLTIECKSKTKITDLYQQWSAMGNFLLEQEYECINCDIIAVL